MSAIARRTKSMSRIATLSLLAFVLAFAALPTLAHAAEVDSEETEAIVSFTAGDLTLEDAPTFNFGSRAITPDLETYSATSVSAPLEVSDLRGTAEGWKVIVSLSRFTASEGTIDTLQGAYISIDASDVSGVGGTVGQAPVVPGDLKIESDNTETAIFVAAEDSGMGVWKNVWEGTDVELTVLPGTAHSSTNKATLTWTLQSAP